MYSVFIGVLHFKLTDMLTNSVFLIVLSRDVTIRFLFFAPQTDPSLRILNIC